MPHSHRVTMAAQLGIPPDEPKDSQSWRRHLCTLRRTITNSSHRITSVKSLYPADSSPLKYACTAGKNLSKTPTTTLSKGEAHSSADTNWGPVPRHDNRILFPHKCSRPRECLLRDEILIVVVFRRAFKLQRASLPLQQLMSFCFWLSFVWCRTCLRAPVLIILDAALRPTSSPSQSQLIDCLLFGIISCRMLAPK